MKTTLLTVGALGLSLLGTGCVATHKYVAKTIAPVEQRVSGTEAKNTDQDKQLSTHTTEIADLDKDAESAEALRSAVHFNPYHFNAHYNLESCFDWKERIRRLP